ncbi:hypothetical protein HDV01_005191 [Terramyces sp. JEL0728]|nr:hypothetical protein HDV01_005191 [Terramyces sp. JEL0728]
MGTIRKNNSIDINQMDDDQLSQMLGFDVSDSSALEKAIFTNINEGNRVAIVNIFQNYPSSTSILQILLTTTYPNKDYFYTHDPEVIRDADELLGESLENLNAIQIACILGEEDLGMDILQFVNDFTEEINAKKILYEFMGRIWGDGNTTLHLASFMGMSDLVQMMIELGAAVGKINNRKYKPVDCAGDDVTRTVFETAIETIKSPNDTSPLTPSKGVDESNKGHSKSSSLDSGRRSPAGSKSRSSRAGTVSSAQPFKIDSLLRTDSSQSSLQKKQRKNVKFDKGVLLLHLCQHGDSTQECRDQVYDCLGITENETNKSAFDVNNLCLPQQWLSPLHLGCSHGRLEIVKILLTRTNVAVNIRDKEGWTPLHCASAEGHVEVINLLGRCQGSIYDTDQSNKEWTYVLDGPINLVPVNDDDDLPEDVALESRAKEIKAIFKKKYPPKEAEVNNEEDEESDNVEDVAPLKKSFSDNLKRIGSVMKSSMRHQKREEEQNDDEESPESKNPSKQSEPTIIPAPVIAATNLQPTEKSIPLKADPLQEITKEVINSSGPNLKSENRNRVAEPIPAKPAEPVADLPKKPVILGKELKATAVSIEPKNNSELEKVNARDTIIQPKPQAESIPILRPKDEQKTSNSKNTVSIPLSNTPKVETEISYEPEIIKTPVKNIQKTGSTSELKSPLRIEIVRAEEEQQSQLSFEQWKLANKHIMLASPIVPKTPTDGSRKERLSYLRSKTKPNNELDLESAKHSAEQMRRPVELQRRSSKSNRDKPILDQSGFGASYYMNEQAAPGKVESIKKVFTVEKEKSNGSLENLATEGALPRMVSSVKDKIKMFQPSAQKVTVPSSKLK